MEHEVPVKTQVCQAIFWRTPDCADSLSSVELQQFVLHQRKRKLKPGCGLYIYPNFVTCIISLCSGCCTQSREVSAKCCCCFTHVKHYLGLCSHFYIYQLTCILCICSLRAGWLRSTTATFVPRSQSDFSLLWCDQPQQLWECPDKGNNSCIHKLPRNTSRCKQECWNFTGVRIHLVNDYKTLLCWYVWLWLTPCNWACMWTLTPMHAGRTHQCPGPSSSRCCLQTV